MAGEMFELSSETGPKEKFSGEYKEAFYQGLVFIGRQKNYKDGWAFWKYKEKFKIEPPWKKIASPPNQEVINWLQMKAIAFAKSRK